MSAELVERARRIVVDRDGPAAAAWLVGQHRPTLHRLGAVRFVLPRGYPLPPWMGLALAHLREREGWIVKSVDQGERRAWTVRWLGWRRWAADRRTVAHVDG